LLIQVKDDNDDFGSGLMQALRSGPQRSSFTNQVEEANNGSFFFAPIFATLQL